MTDDLPEAERKYYFAQKMIVDTLERLRQEICQPQQQLAKLDFLLQLSDEDRQAFSLLLADAEIQEDYSPGKWARNPRLNRLAPEAMSKNGRLTAEKLILIG